MKENFDDILSIYESNLENLLERYKRSLISDEYLAGALAYNKYWFEEAKSFLDDNDVQYGKYKAELTDSDKEKYDTDKNFPLVGILEYRGYEVPVYNDDYGQQEFAKFLGKDISGGSYNFYPERDFTAEIDYLLEAQKVEEIKNEKKSAKSN